MPASDVGLVIARDLLRCCVSSWHSNACCQVVCHGIAPWHSVTCAVVKAAGMFEWCDEGHLLARGTQTVTTHQLPYWQSVVTAAAQQWRLS